MDVSKTTPPEALKAARCAVEYKRGGLAPWQARLVEAHIDTQLTGDIPVEALAGLVNLSVSHFARAFKSTFGQPPHSYILAGRVRRAQALMLSTDRSLAQIAFAVGLFDQSHLSRLFRRHTGETPHAWRRARWTPEGAGQILQ